MWFVGRRMAVAVLFTMVLVGVGAEPAAAIHHGATLDCGADGTYTIKTGEQGASVFRPTFFQVNILEQDGKIVATLVPFRISVNGQPLEAPGNAAEPVSDHVGFATCSFTGSNGDYFVLEGPLNRR